MLLSGAAAAAAAAAGSVVADVNEKTGAYTVSVDGIPWFDSGKEKAGVFVITSMHTMLQKCARLYETVNAAVMLLPCYSQNGTPVSKLLRTKTPSIHTHTHTHT